MQEEARFKVAKAKVDQWYQKFDKSQDGLLSREVFPQSQPYLKSQALSNSSFRTVP